MLRPDFRDTFLDVVGWENARSIFADPLPPSLIDFLGNLYYIPFFQAQLIVVLSFEIVKGNKRSQRGLFPRTSGMTI